MRTKYQQVKCAHCGNTKRSLESAKNPFPGWVRHEKQPWLSEQIGELWTCTKQECVAFIGPKLLTASPVEFVSGKRRSILVLSCDMPECKVSVETDTTFTRVGATKPFGHDWLKGTPLGKDTHLCPTCAVSATLC